MTQFIITYLNGEHPSSPEQQKEHFVKYQQWLQDLGTAVVSPANPFKDTHTIYPDGIISEGSSVAMSGYTVIEVSSIEEAIDLAKGCPFLEINGKLEVSELLKMG